jgi:hypothetical protein
MPITRALCLNIIDGIKLLLIVYAILRENKTSLIGYFHLKGWVIRILDKEGNEHQYRPQKYNAGAHRHLGQQYFEKQKEQHKITDENSNRDVY